MKTATDWPLPLDVRTGGENPRIVDFPGALAKVNPEDFPVFWRAIQHSEPAHNTTITFGDGYQNYMQINRDPFVYRIDGTDFAEKAGEALRKHLEAIELTLVRGEPSQEMRDGYVRFGTCGGVHHYLGRELLEDDLVKWRPLRQPLLLLMRGEGDLYNDYWHHGEWLTEFSLEVLPGASQVEPCESPS